MNTHIERIEAIGKCKLIGTHPAGSTEWLEQRRSGIGGSDIGVVLNKSPYKSQYSLYVDKLTPQQAKPATGLMRIGQILEPAIIEILKENHLNLSIHTGNLTFASLEDERFRANPDAIAENEFGDMYIVEIKYTTKYWGRELPQHYRLQVLWYMFVTGLHNEALVGVLSPFGYDEFGVTYDPEQVELMKQAALTFLSWVENKTPPALDGSESTLEAIRGQNSIDEDLEVEINPETYNQLLDSQEKLDFWQGMTNLRKSEIMRQMQGAKYGLVDGQTVVQLRQRGQGLPYLQIMR